MNRIQKVFAYIGTGISLLSLSGCYDVDYIHEEYRTPAETSTPYYGPPDASQPHYGPPSASNTVTVTPNNVNASSPYYGPPSS